MLVEYQKYLKQSKMEIDYNYQCTYIHFRRFIIQFGMSFSITFDPSVRYTIWSIFIGSTFSSTAQYACIQTQAQRFMCVKDTKSAQRYLKKDKYYFETRGKWRISDFFGFFVDSESRKSAVSPLF
jgi:hypothetical protein